jgi:hypothetical protein
MTSPNGQLALESAAMTPAPSVSPRSANPGRETANDDPDGIHMPWYPPTSSAASGSTPRDVEEDVSGDAGGDLDHAVVSEGTREGDQTGPWLVPATAGGVLRRPVSCKQPELCEGLDVGQEGRPVVQAGVRGECSTGRGNGRPARRRPQDSPRLTADEAAARPMVDVDPGAFRPLRPCAYDGLEGAEVVRGDHDVAGSEGVCDHERPVQDEVGRDSEQRPILVAERLALGSVHDDGVDPAGERSQLARHRERCAAAAEKSNRRHGCLQCRPG